MAETICRILAGPMRAKFDTPLRSSAFRWAAIGAAIAFGWTAFASSASVETSSRLVAQASFSLLLAALAMAAMSAPGSTPLRALGLVRSRFGWRQRVAAIAVCCAWSFLGTALLPAAQPGPIFERMGGILQVGNRFALHVIVLVVFVVLPAVCEELFFRGFVQRMLTTRSGPALGILVTSIGFAALHGSPGPVAFAFVMSLLLGMIVRLSGSTWEAIAIHGLNNLLSLLSFIYSSFPWAGRIE